MYRACIAVADASRARLFTLARIAGAGGVTETLTEHQDLIEPARRLHGSELYSDEHPGIGHAGTLQFGLDDHRTAHMENLDATFARSIIDEVTKLAGAAPHDRVILCASPTMLGELRRARQHLAPQLEVEEVGHNLVQLSPSALRERLGGYGVLPARTHA